MGNYYLRSTNSDLTGPAPNDFNKALADTTAAGVNQTNISIAANTSETSYGFSVSGSPGLANWGGGTHRVSIQVQAANSSITAHVRLSRISSSGTVLEQSGEVTFGAIGSVGTKTFPDIAYTWGAGNTTDRLRVDYRFQNTHATMSQSFGLTFNTVGNKISVPWLDSTVQEINATGETAAFATHDSADDVTIWDHPTAPTTDSLIIGQNKNAGGLYTWRVGAPGTQQQSIDVDPTRLYNNVEFKRGFTLNGAVIDLVAASRRGISSEWGVAFYKMTANAAGSYGTLSLINDILDSSYRPYGLTFYVSPLTGKYYLFITQDATPSTIRQYELGVTGTAPNQTVTMTQVRSWAMGSGLAEGMAADDVLRRIYISEESVGVWRYGAEPGDSTTGTQVDTITDIGGRILPQAEGQAIAVKGDTGYLIVVGQNADLADTSSGRTKFEMYDRNTNAWVKSFQIQGGAIDGVEGCDGVAVTTISLGGSYTSGMFAAHDDYNAATNSENYKLVPYGNLIATDAAPTWGTPGLAAGTPTASEVPLTWNDATGETSFIIQYRTAAGPGPWITFDAVAPGTTSATVTGLSAGVQYDFRVGAVSTGGTIFSSTISATTVAPKGQLSYAPLIVPQAAVGGPTNINGTDSGTAASSESPNLTINASATDSGTATSAESSSLTGTTGGTESSSMTSAEAGTLAIVDTKAGTDSHLVASSESANLQTVDQKSATDSSVLISDEAGSLSISDVKSGTDSHVLGSSESTSISISDSKSGTDSHTVASSESASKATVNVAIYGETPYATEEITKSGTDSGTIASSETGTTLESNTITGIDSGTVIGIEAGSVARSSSVTDSTVVTSDELGTIQAGINSTESSQLSSDELPMILRQSSLGETGTTTSDEAGIVSVPLAVTESASVISSESASVQVLTDFQEKSATDSTSITSSESAQVIVTIDLSETGLMTSSEQVSLISSYLISESGQITSVEVPSSSLISLITESTQIQSTELGFTGEAETKSVTESSSLSSTESTSSQSILSIFESALLSSLESPTSQVFIAALELSSLIESTSILVGVVVSAQEANLITLEELASIQSFDIKSVIESSLLTSLETGSLGIVEFLQGSESSTVISSENISLIQGLITPAKIVISDRLKSLIQLVDQGKVRVELEDVEIT